MISYMPGASPTLCFPTSSVGGSMKQILVSTSDNFTVHACVLYTFLTVASCYRLSQTLFIALSHCHHDSCTYTTIHVHVIVCTHVQMLLSISIGLQSTTSHPMQTWFSLDFLQQYWYGRHLSSTCFSTEPSLSLFNPSKQPLRKGRVSSWLDENNTQWWTMEELWPWWLCCTYTAAAELLCYTYMVS